MTCPRCHWRGCDGSAARCENSRKLQSVLSGRAGLIAVPLVTERKFTLVSGASHRATMRANGSVFVHGVGEFKDWWGALMHFAALGDAITGWDETTERGD
jgi:hypothetical protein